MIVWWIVFVTLTVVVRLIIWNLIRGVGENWPTNLCLPSVEVWTKTNLLDQWTLLEKLNWPLTIVDVHIDSSSLVALQHRFHPHHPRLVQDLFR